MKKTMMCLMCLLLILGIGGCSSKEIEKEKELKPLKISDDYSCFDISKDDFEYFLEVKLKDYLKDGKAKFVETDEENTFKLELINSMNLEMKTDDNNNKILKFKIGTDDCEKTSNHSILLPKIESLLTQELGVDKNSDLWDKAFIDYADSTLSDEGDRIGSSYDGHLKFTLLYGTVHDTDKFYTIYEPSKFNSQEEFEKENTKP